MYYRKNVDLEIKNLISVNNYLNKNYGKDKIKKEKILNQKSLNMILIVYLNIIQKEMKILL